MILMSLVDARAAIRYAWLLLLLLLPGARCRVLYQVAGHPTEQSLTALAIDSRQMQVRGDDDCVAVVMHGTASQRNYIRGFA
jgi:hypothetical protein